MTSRGQSDPPSSAQKLLASYHAATSDSMKILALSELAYFHHDYLGDDHYADSISEIAIQVAEKSHRPELLFLALNCYLESNDLHENYRKALDYGLKSEQLSFPSKEQQMMFRCYKNLASVYLSGYEFDKALEYSYKLLSIAGTSENPEMKTESYLFIGRSLEGKNQKIEAFRNYLNAASLSERLKKTTLRRECYSRLSDFYNFSKLYSKATHYKLLERALIEGKKPVDSLAWMWTEYDLQVIDINSNNNQLYEINMHDILSFAMRHQNARLLNYEIALVRTHYIEAGKVGLLREFYAKKLTGELNRLESENPSLYFRLKALFCEEGKRADSALYYFNLAEKTLQSDPNIILKSNFYNRFGQFLLRTGKKDAAIAKFSTSYDLAKSAFYIEYMIAAARNLQAIYAEKGDYKNAFNYALMNKVLSDSLNNISKKDQLLIMEIDHETRQRDIVAEQQKQSTIRRHYLQYSAITVGILTVFVILIMLGSFKVPEWIVKTTGFFSFIFLFEFIILLADQQIHELTHGEPWKVLLIKIGLIAILLPLHHSIEKKVITYLLNHRLLDISRVSIRRWVKRRTGGQADKRTSGQADRRTSEQ
jgi:hypothetical protein